MFSWIIRHGEIFLKGKNKFMFENNLIRNIRDCLKKNNVKFENVKLFRNRVLVYSEEDCSCLKNVFGISSFSRSIEIGQDIEGMKKIASGLYKKGSFRISAQRVEKDFKYNSSEINKIVGAHVVKKKKARVELENPDVNIGIELFNKRAYLFNERINGLGGLPVGIEGNVGLLLEDKDSLIAGILMLKRGCSLSLIKKKDVDYGLLKKFCYGFELKEYKKMPDNIKAIVVNDNIDYIKKRGFKLTVFRPLIGYTRDELEKWLMYA